MDLTDLALCRILLEDSRTPYSEMARVVGLSTQAVHRRVQALFDEEVIQGTVARPSLSAMGLIHVIVNGHSRVKTIDEAVSRLSSSPSIAVVQVASGNHLYVHAGVEGADDLANLVAFIQREAEIPSPEVGLVQGNPPAPQGPLSRSDLRIISALRNDSRRTVAGLSSELGMTSKTIRNRIKRMADHGLVTFTIRWRPDAQGDTMGKIHITLRDDIERQKVALYLVSHFSENLVNTVSFGNLPNHLTVTVWTASVRDMTKLCKELLSTGLVESVVPVVLLDIHYFKASL